MNFKPTIRSKADRPDRMTRAAKRALAVFGGAVVMAAFGPAAMAASEPRTKLVSYGTQTALLVSGHRADSAAQVDINGHPVAVEGGTSWRVMLPVDTVRAWSTPMARSIAITVRTSAADTAETQPAALPIGLLGHVTDLAVLEIGTR
jgi:hypothetical protein